MARYLLQREIVDTSANRIWAFLGDGELDEVESIGALGVAGREHLDNLIFVVNCNLQRLDGPVRGNGKIIQEAEAMFRGAGWNVIKVIWGSKWDELLARDIDGVLLDKMNTTPDGEFQKYATESGAYIREHFFGPDPRLRRLVEHLSDDDLQALPRGGHDYRKLYAAYKLATEQVGQPTVILAKTVKGWTLGPEIEARNATHQIKKMTKAQLLALRDRLYLQEEIPDDALDAEQPPYYRPPEGSPATSTSRAAARSWPAPSRPRRPARHAPRVPDADGLLRHVRAGSGTQSASTTMAFARLLRNLVRDPALGPLRRPHRPRRGPHLRPRAAHRRVQDLRPRGPALHPGRLRPHPPLRRGPQGPDPPGGHHRGRRHGRRSSRSPPPMPPGAGPCSPIYLFYSMFGFQRVGDLAWLLGDIRGRGILAGCTAGRTTLQGEGLQHDDGHSPLLASVNPAAHIYDPAFAYEIGRHHGRRHHQDHGARPRGPLLVPHPLQRELPHAALPEGDDGDAVRAGHPPGMYRFAEPAEPRGRRATAPTARPLLFSGPMWQAAMEARACWPRTGASRPTPGR